MVRTTTAVAAWILSTVATGCGSGAPGAEVWSFDELTRRASLVAGGAARYESEPISLSGALSGALVVEARLRTSTSCQAGLGLRVLRAGAEPRVYRKSWIRSPEFRTEQLFFQPPQGARTAQVLLTAFSERGPVTTADRARGPIDHVDFEDVTARSVDRRPPLAQFDDWRIECRLAATESAQPYSVALVKGERDVVPDIRSILPCTPERFAATIEVDAADAPGGTDADWDEADWTVTLHSEGDFELSFAPRVGRAGRWIDLGAKGVATARRCCQEEAGDATIGVSIEFEGSRIDITSPPGFDWDADEYEGGWEFATVTEHDLPWPLTLSIVDA